MIVRLVMIDTLLCSRSRRAVSTIQETELLRRGYSLSVPLAPISRIEQYSLCSPSHVLLRMAVHVALQDSVFCMELLTRSGTPVYRHLYEPAAACLLIDLKKWLQLYIDTRPDYYYHLMLLLEQGRAYRCVVECCVLYVHEYIGTRNITRCMSDICM